MSSEFPVIENDKIFHKVRSRYARVLLFMVDGQSITVRETRTLSSYRVAAFRYGIGIRTQKCKSMWRVWRLHGPEDRVVDPRARFPMRKRKEK